MQDKNDAAIIPVRNANCEFGPSGRDNPGGIRAAVSSDRGGTLRSGVSRMDRILHETISTHENTAAVFGGRCGAPGSRSSDGSAFGQDRSTSCLERPDFSLNVPQNGYAWWYIDAISSCGAQALTIIAFIGSVFSPYYAAARRNGQANPENYVSINVALYGKGLRRWCMTERGSTSLRRSPDTLQIGPSSLRWNDNALDIAIDEVAVPVPRRVRGRIRLTPETLPGQEFKIDRSGKHTWQPIAPLARVDVQFDDPALNWSGSAYCDHNRGKEPLEHAFRSWNWSRQDCSSAQNSSADVFYDIVERDGFSFAIAPKFEASGGVTFVSPPPRAALDPGLWGVARSTRCDTGSSATITETLEDAPFYTRNLISTTIGGATAKLVHESLDLDRFRSPIVQAMLAFKMPRRTICC